MLERAVKQRITHRKSGLEFSDLQKLNLYQGNNRRVLAMLRAHLQLLGSRNPQISTFAWDAMRSIGAIEDALENEYQRDRATIALHRVEVERDTIGQ